MQSQPNSLPHRTLPYRGTADTVAHMMAVGQGPRGMRSLPVRLWTENVVRYVTPRDTASQLAAIYRAFVPRFRYLHDPSSPKDPRQGTELVKDPERLVEEMRRHGVALGDCDDASGFLYAAPRTIGIRTELARVGFQSPLAGRRPGFSHVFAVGFDQHGRALAMDPVAGFRTPQMLQRAQTGVLGLGGF